MSLPDAFRELCAVCRPRPDLNDGGMEAAASRLFKALNEYPETVAMTALDMWPRRSEWFPTEKELRDLCEEIASQAAIEAAARGSVGGGLYNYPVGNTVPFVREVTKLRGEDYAKSWLAGGITCLFSANTIHTTRIGEERLNRDFGLLAQHMGIEIERDDTCSKMLAAYCDQNNLRFEQRKVRR